MEGNTMWCCLNKNIKETMTDIYIINMFVFNYHTINVISIQMRQFYNCINMQMI